MARETGAGHWERGVVGGRRHVGAAVAGDRRAEQVVGRAALAEALDAEVLVADVRWRDLHLHKVGAAVDGGGGALGLDALDRERPAKLDAHHLLHVVAHRARKTEGQVVLRSEVNNFE